MKKTAAIAFHHAVALIEDLRAPLPAEEFRTAFFADKLTPYAELVRLCLHDDRGARASEALGYVERARSRALVDRLGGAVPFRTKPRDDYEAGLLTRLEETRAELNWFYNQINRPVETAAVRSSAMMTSLHESVREREATILELTRQLQQSGDIPHIQVDSLDLEQLQRDLGADTALVEYFMLDDELLAFVVTNEDVIVQRGLGCAEAIKEVVEQFHHQISTLRYGILRLHRHMAQLPERARHYLLMLYQMTFQPIEAMLGDRRLLVAPYGMLHYVPFHALYDGVEFVIERREVCYVPSAQVLHYCLSRPSPAICRSVLVGFPDAQIPRVRDEVHALKPFFTETVIPVDEQATLSALHAHASTADVLHLTCHGQFRQDNPLFSSLRLADGVLTVQDTYNLELNCRLVVLSACETGVSAITPGDELIGLVRGFFAVGVLVLLVSLWLVDDDATAALMMHVYARLRNGDGVAAALRAAQYEMLRLYAHPYSRSPFVLFGRWN
jgi:CHAT domain-containing protein